MLSRAKASSTSAVTVPPATSSTYAAGNSPGIGVGLADRAGEGHLGMVHQRILDLRRIDVVAAADDQVLGAAGDPDVAVGVDPAEIPGPEVAALGQRPAIALGIGVDLAPTPGLRTQISPISSVAQRLRIAPAGSQLQDLHVGIRKRKADAADLPLAVGRVDRDEARRLGHAVSLQHPHPGRILEAVEELDRHRRRAADREPQRRDVGIDLALHQRRDRCRHRDHEARPCGARSASRGGP